MIASGVPILTLGSIRINVYVVLVLSAIVLLDLLARLLVTGNLESVAFDISVIGLTYSATEALQGVINQPKESLVSSQWFERSMVNLIVFLAVASVLAGAARLHAEMFSDLFGTLHQRMKDAGEVDDGFVLDETFRKMSEQYFIVSLLARKQGKLRRREHLVELINRMLPEKFEVLPTDLLLPRTTRLVLLVGLLILGATALLTPAITLV